LFGALKKDITPYIIDIFDKQFQIDAKEVCTKLFIVGGGAEVPPLWRSDVPLVERRRVAHMC